MSRNDIKLVTNAAGREVPAQINGAEAIAYQGVGKHRPTGRKNGPPIRSCSRRSYRSSIAPFRPF